MVWGLIPTISLQGAQKYYVFSKGTYKVGRKDCDIFVQDYAVSRLHSEIIVDKMVSRVNPSHVRVRDCSKFGTFINKDSGGKALHKQEAEVGDGDLVTFGTGNATFRLCFIPVVIFVQRTKNTRPNASIQDAVSSIGACTTRKWTPECTHVLVDESSPVTLDIIEAVVAKKFIVLNEWIKVLAEKNIRTEFPSCKPFLPVLSLEGMLVKLTEPKSREKCLDGYTFVLGSLNKYKFGEKFQSLLELVNVKFLHADEFCSNSQISADGEDNQYVLVVPGESENEFIHISDLSSLSRVTDMKVIAAILSGHLDSSIIESPPVVVLSSHSTDETIVADSDVEVDTAISNRDFVTEKTVDAVKHVFKDEDVIESEHVDNTEDVNVFKESNKHNVCKDKGVDDSEGRNYSRGCEENKNHGDHCDVEAIRAPVPMDEEIVAVKRLDKGDESVTDRHENSDIIFTQDLIVRDTRREFSVRSNPKTVVDFKCFRKREMQSGNSFKNLIPFSKDPYRESDGGSNETVDYMKEEKKRKQLEAIAEDLFNNEKGRKRATAASSIQALLARRG